LSAGGVCLALGFGWGRAGFGEGYGLGPAYIDIALPVLFCIYYNWGACYPYTTGRFVQTVLLILVCSLFWRNCEAGLDYARSSHSQEVAFVRDLRAGTPPLVLAQRYWPTFAPNDPADADGVIQELDGYMRMLNRAGIGKFRLLKQPLPSPREIDFSNHPASSHHITLQQDGTARGTGDNPSLLFALNKPQFVYGIRLTCSCDVTANPASLHLLWQHSKYNDFDYSDHAASQSCRLMRPEETTVTIWVYQTIDHFRVKPECDPCVFRISAIVLLVP
jgi:hypothetical protein